MSHNIKEKIMIHGVPRSGTSWLGQIFNSNENVSYRFQPLFSYAFKDFLNEKSSEEDIQIFFDKILNTNDSFILQKERLKDKKIPNFKKNTPTHLVAKNVRYHNIVENILQNNKAVKFIFIIRNPCGVINSWMNAPREFICSKDKQEWKHANLKNNNKKEEYYGYLKWKEAANLFLDLQKEYRNNINIITYENLCLDTTRTIEEVFDFCNLNISMQTLGFIEESKSKNFIEDKYSVYKKQNRYGHWRKQLHKEIQDYIYNDLKYTNLYKFLR